MGAFRWISDEVMPEARDLRRDGWRLASAGAPPDCIAVVDASGLDGIGWARLLTATCHDARRLMLVSGANAPSERANLLEAGFGDAIGDGISVVEYHARARRLLDLTSWVPRERRIGAKLRLDLISRKAFIADEALDLNPREFGLLWRLADTPGEPVSKQSLTQDVWRLGFVPETNSIAVHVSRLRSKLAVVGLSHILTTVPGGYCLSLSAHPVSSFTIPTHRLRQR
ncbi:winged helix-turn-helix transcriptional regulator [Novosphingobium sp. M1R2S20]|uniref:Winged-helix domain-containing protein n=1 Tax=Novosphingobium rhizovicinum TaxID=3228928 RepID=A0ABV3RA78_9SPHN